MTTFNLQIPELLPLQASPDVTVNRALRRIDAILSLGVLTMQTLTAPPGSPAEGDMHVVGSPATGAWSGFEDYIAYYSNGQWEFVSYIEGLLVWSIPDTTLFVYTYAFVSAGAWTALFVLP